MRGRWMRALLLVLCLGLVLGLPGCQRPDDGDELEPGEYYVYYLDPAVTKLSPRVYRPQSKDVEGIVEELMEQFVTVPQDVDSQPALSDKVMFRRFQREGQILYLYFDANYTAMKPDREILCRAALALMLTQVEGIDYINIYSGDQPLLERSGKPVGMLAGSDFIFNARNINAFEKTELTLFFTDETGQRLLEEKREVMYNINTSLEQLIVEQLVKGPGQEGHFATLPTGLKILNLTVNDGVCYVNLDSSFLEMQLNGNEYVPIYSIVNSLCQLSSVMKVQFLINGSQGAIFKDVIPLNSTFEWSDDYL